MGYRMVDNGESSAAVRQLLLQYQTAIADESHVVPYKE